MLRHAIPFVASASPAAAEVCDRAAFGWHDAMEGGPVRDARINFTFESGLISHAMGAGKPCIAYETMQMPRSG